MNDTTTQADIDRALARGQIGLFDAVMLMAVSKLPLSEYVVDLLESAYQSYTDGEIGDIAEPLGIAVKRREINAQKRETWRSHVRFHVDSFHEQGHTKQDPGYHENTAFHRAAELLHRSPSQIFDTYYGRA